VVGFLWTAVSPIAGFGYGAVLCTLGAALLAATSRENTRGCPDIATGVN